MEERAENISKRLWNHILYCRHTQMTMSTTPYIQGREKFKPGRTVHSPFFLICIIRTPDGSNRYNFLERRGFEAKQES